MRTGILLFILSYTITTFSQGSTEIYLFEIIKNEEGIKLENQKNISNNEGYDNQPFFDSNQNILFSSTRNQQTDIASYSINEETLKWISDTPNGSEYSPNKIPDSDGISAIRLDTNGKQLLYCYDPETRESQVILEDLKVGYHVWFNNHIIVSSVLEGSSLSLTVSDINKNTNQIIQKNIGRSLHKIPNSDLISYISKENQEWKINSLDPLTGVTETIINTIPGAEDLCWLNDGTIIMGKYNKLFSYNPKTDQKWKTFYTFTGDDDKNIIAITRLAANAKGNLLAIVSDFAN
ncbi:TolB-like translocation protein [Aquimarina pacifica]|uniref:hypothetical protein n=1 Tax=Aquimarina pacifica TaxID=1296415 RepID=UPI0004727E4A|nr:hypothetical protein [Aquimarina pacifica]